jgi:hypothetical protein
MTTQLVEVVCNDCHGAYAVLGPGPKHQACFTPSMFFICRRCRLLQLGEYVERLLDAGPEEFGCKDEDVAHYTQQFFSAVDEMYCHLMEKKK